MKTESKNYDVLVSLNDLYAQFQKWQVNYNNPHHVTAGQVGCYTKAEVLQLLDKYVPFDGLPLSIFGDPNSSTLPATVKTTTIAATITIGDAMSVVLLSGVRAVFQQRTWTFSVLTGSTWYLYVTSQDINGVTSAVLEATRTPREESPINFYVGRLTNTNGRITSVLEPVVMFGTYRLSATPRGSAIPVSTGYPTDKGTYRW